MLSPQEALAELNMKIERVADSIEYIKEKQEDVAENVTHIRTALYDPDTGLYARLKELEGYKHVSTKLLWLLVTSLIALGTATWWQTLGGG